MIIFDTRIHEFSCALFNWSVLTLDTGGSAREIAVSSGSCNAECFSVSFANVDAIYRGATRGDEGRRGGPPTASMGVYFIENSAKNISAHQRTARSNGFQSAAKRRALDRKVS